MAERLIFLAVVIGFAVMGEGLASMCLLAGYGIGWKQAEADAPDPCGKGEQA
jgi:3-hydroxyacyl-CoA dehydrogenase